MFFELESCLLKIFLFETQVVSKESSKGRHTLETLVIKDMASMVVMVANDQFNNKEVRCSCRGFSSPEMSSDDGNQNESKMSIKHILSYY